MNLYDPIFWDIILNAEKFVEKLNFIFSACGCNPEGSLTPQCNHETGECVCVEGIGGFKCDKCARGFTGRAPYCNTCGECFDNWDYILGKLKGNTLRFLLLCCYKDTPLINNEFFI